MNAKSTQTQPDGCKKSRAVAKLGLRPLSASRLSSDWRVSPAPVVVEEYRGTLEYLEQRDAAHRAVRGEGCSLGAWVWRVLRGR